MAFFGNGNSGRNERAEMEEAAKHGQNEVDFEQKLRLQTGDAKFAKTYRVRGKLYDKIKVSLRTMDIIIYSLVAMIIVALIIGIVTGQ